LPIPFLHPRVIAHLENLIKPDWRILEHGSGGSTLWFAERCKEVVAIEHDKKWFDALRHKKNDRVYLVLFLGAINELMTVDNKYDLMLIDGEPLEERAFFLKSAYELVKPGGIVVLDNANREVFAEEREWLRNNCKSYDTFDGNEGGTVYLVTEFYTLKG